LTKTDETITALLDALNYGERVKRARKLSGLAKAAAVAVERGLAKMKRDQLFDSSCIPAEIEAALWAADELLEEWQAQAAQERAAKTDKTDKTPSRGGELQ